MAHEDVVKRPVGLRIRHPSLHDCTLLVPHPGNAEGRSPKDYRIHLDGNGETIVSERVWQRLVEARESGLSPHDLLILNVTHNPPTIIAGDVPGTQVRTYRQAPSGVTDQQLLSVAQSLAPPGVRASITTKE